MPKELSLRNFQKSLKHRMVNANIEYMVMLLTHYLCQEPQDSAMLP
jgi:hypothetical protein